MHSPFMTMAAVNVLKLSHACLVSKIKGLACLGFKVFFFGVNPSLLANFTLIASMCVLLTREVG